MGSIRLLTVGRSENTWFQGVKNKNGSIFNGGAVSLYSQLNSGGTYEGDLFNQSYVT